MSDAADLAGSPRRARRRVITVTAAALVGAALVAAAAFWLSGGRWYVVRTPSMGTTAPVGTLVLTRPASVDALHVGDIIAFHPPSQPAETYTHRIVSIKNGHVHTRGDINGIADPWALTDKDIVGHATVVVPRLGWLVRALPMLAIGGLLVWALTRWWVAPALRGPLQLLGTCLTFAITVAVLRPFVGVAQLATTSAPNGVSRISVVSTGLLPVRLTPAGGHGHATPVDLATAGKTGVSTLTGGTDGGHYQLDTHLHLPWFGWLLLAAFCALPLVWTLAVSIRPTAAPRHRVAASPRHRVAVAA